MWRGMQRVRNVNVFLARTVETVTERGEDRPSASFFPNISRGPIAWYIYHVSKAQNNVVPSFSGPQVE